jgi:predicted DNA-binding protein
MRADHLPPDIERRLTALAKKAVRSKSSHARKTVMCRIEDIVDLYLARKRLRRGRPHVSLERLEHDFAKRAKR